MFYCSGFNKKEGLMKPFELIISVNGEGQSKLGFDGPGKKEITTSQVVGYLAAELEKYELMIATDRTIKTITKQMSGIQVVKDIPMKLRGKKQ